MNPEIMKKMKEISPKHWRIWLGVGGDKEDARRDAERLFNDSQRRADENPQL